MKKAIFFVYFIFLVVSGLSAQNWDINTLHRVNSWDGKFDAKIGQIDRVFTKKFYLCCHIYNNSLIIS